MFKSIKFLAATIPVALVGLTITAQMPEANEYIKEQAISAWAWVSEMWRRVETDPAPYLSVIGTFIATALYYKLRGRSLRESVEMAATRVTVINATTPQAEPEISNARARAHARTTRNQLINDQLLLEHRMKTLPKKVEEAERNFCYAENELGKAKKALEDKQKQYEQASQELNKLVDESTRSNDELAEIKAEIKALEAHV